MSEHWGSAKRRLSTPSRLFQKNQLTGNPMNEISTNENLG
jgi:hypothetical protein